jgi:hypothetical protein
MVGMDGATLTLHVSIVVRKQAIDMKVTLASKLKQFVQEDLIRDFTLISISSLKTFHLDMITAQALLI